jgi:hypothetical protein
VKHPGLQQLLDAMYRLLAEGEPPTLENLRTRIDNQPLITWAMERQEVGLANPERKAWLDKVVECFRRLQQESATQELQSKLHSTDDHAAALELLRQLQNRTSS